MNKKIIVFLFIIILIQIKCIESNDPQLQQCQESHQGLLDTDLALDLFGVNFNPVDLDFRFLGNFSMQSINLDELGAQKKIIHLQSIPAELKEPEKIPIEEPEKVPEQTLLTAAIKEVLGFSKDNKPKPRTVKSRPKKFGRKHRKTSIFHTSREPVRDDFFSEEEFEVAWKQWRKIRDNNNQDVRKCRALAAADASKGRKNVKN